MKTIYTLLALTVVPFNVSFGQSWWPQNSNSAAKLQDVNFHSDNNGYLFGDTLSTTIYTNNAGAVWSDVNMTFTKANINSSALPTSSIIYAVGKYDVLGGKGIVMRSQNSGSTWMADTSFTEDLFDVQFTSAVEGFISGENGFLARTLDGGNNWLQLTSGTGEDLFSLKFINDSTGWAVGTVDVNATIVHTNDGGTTWTAQTSGLVETLYAVDFVDNMNGWAVGELGNIISTTDGGVTWSPQISPVSVALFDVDFVDQNYGWAVGEGGTVLKTIDGGSNWVIETSGTTTDILSIHMRDTTRGWFCGDGGEVRVYAENPPTVSLIEQINSPAVLVYPNPASDVLNFDLVSQSTFNSFSIYSLDGRILISENIDATINYVEISSLDSGSYIIVFEDKVGTYSKKIKFIVE